LINRDEKNIAEAVSLKAGQAIYTTGARYSMGCRVKWTTSNGNVKYGFVTSAHGNKKDDYVYANSLLGSSCLGPIVKRKFSGSADVSVVRLDCSASAYTMTNYIYGISTSTKLSSSPANLYVGQLVEKVGSTTGHTSGYITNLSTTATYKGVTFTDYIQSTYTSANGDSGGIIYSYDANSSTVKVVGNHKASGGGYAYGTKYSNIKSAFSTTLSLY